MIKRQRSEKVNLWDSSFLTSPVILSGSILEIKTIFGTTFIGHFAGIAASKEMLLVHRGFHICIKSENQSWFIWSGDIAELYCQDIDTLRG